MSFMNSMYPQKSYRLVQIIYQSTLAVALSDKQLTTFLARARKANRQREITSILVHDNGMFLHILEGPAHAVNDLWESIQRDPRHRNIGLDRYRCINTREYCHDPLAFINAAASSHVATEPLRRKVPYGPVETAIELFETFNEYFYAQEARSWDGTQ